MHVKTQLLINLFGRGNGQVRYITTQGTGCKGHELFLSKSFCADAWLMGEKGLTDEGNMLKIRMKLWR